MAFIITIEDESNRALAKLFTTHDAYLLPDGTQLGISSVPAWCHTCQEFTFTESLESAEEMADAARRFFKFRKFFHKQNRSIFGYRPFYLADWKRLRAQLKKAKKWRVVLTKRKAPRRCLKCGKHDFTVVPRDGSWISHPANISQRIRLRDDYHHAELADETGRLFDTEGVLISGNKTKWS
jgi:hypothetical protein